jgi:hypothetical protein
MLIESYLNLRSECPSRIGEILKDGYGVQFPANPDDRSDMRQQRTGINGCQILDLMEGCKRWEASSISLADFLRFHAAEVKQKTIGNDAWGEGVWGFSE